MDNQFRKFLDTYLEAWRASSSTELTNLISNDFKGREITGGEILDFEFEESIIGWKQGFNFVIENNAKWELNEISIIPLREDEMLVIISATIIMQGESLNTANLFFQTFKKDSSNDWKMIRSYVEAGVPIENLKHMQFKQSS